MTIHSDWSRILHSECPEAFLPKIPKGVDFGVGVIDGHLQLMCLNSGLGTWDRFIQYLFVNPIKKLFDAGCPVVVMCFDSYDSVPIYKSLTQIKRAQRIASVSFRPGEDLPFSIPQDSMAFMMNRNFKLKVIDMVCTLLPQMVAPLMAPHQRLFIDYKRVVEYSAGCTAPIAVPGLYPTGESDIKFARYVDMFGNALIHAIDGDYMAIALLYCAMRPSVGSAKIFIYRQLAQLQEPQKDKKRKLSEKRKKTPKCWVDMGLIYSHIASRMAGAAHAAAGVHAVVALMLCAGTDFSRPIPLIGPKRIWDALPTVSGSLLRAAPVDRDLDYPLFADGVIAVLYKTIFARHVSSSTQGFRAVMRELSASSLSATTLGRLPSDAQVETTLKNINWVVYKYWTVINGPIQAPLDGSNGFVPSPHHVGKVVYEDLREQKSS